MAKIEKLAGDRQYSPMKVRVLSNAGDPVANSTVTWTAPASGPSGTFVSTGTRTMSAMTGADGIAESSVLVGNSTVGSFNVSVGFSVPEGTDPIITTPPAGLAKQGIAPGAKILNRAESDMNFELDKIDQVRTRDGVKYPCYIRVDVYPDNDVATERVMSGAVARGLSIYPIFFGTQTLPVNIGTYPAQWTAAWGNWFTWIELGNEPDEPSLGGTWPVDVYADFVKECSQQIRNVSADKKIVAGSLFNGTNESGTRDAYTPDAYVTALCQRAAGYFDAVSLHLYEDPLARGGWNGWDRTFPVINGVTTAHAGYTVREILDSYGMSSLPIFSTENGLPVRDGNTEEMQRLVVERNFLAARGDYGPLVSTQMVYSMMDDDVPGFGLLRPDRSERPAFHEFRSRCVA